MARSVLSGLQANSPVQKLPADIENRNVPGGPNGKEVSITVETLPVVMYFHGGG